MMRSKREEQYRVGQGGGGHMPRADMVITCLSVRKSEQKFIVLNFVRREDSQKRNSLFDHHSITKMLTSP